MLGQEARDPRRVLGGDGVLASDVGPADPVLVEALALHLEAGDGILHGPLRELEVRPEVLERDELRAVLQVQQHVVEQLRIRLGLEGLVVDEDDVRAAEHGVQVGVLEDVAGEQVHAADVKAPHARAGGELFGLRVREAAGRGHHLDAPALAPDLKGGLEDDVADARAEVQKGLRALQLRVSEDLRAERVLQLAVHVVRARSVGAQFVDAWRDGSGIDLGQDSIDEWER